ncbi:unnamed protein product [Calypogeia fissa]
MDHLLSKIRDLEKEAAKLARQQQQQQVVATANGSTPGEVQSFAHWIHTIRTKAGGWTAGPLVVLSLFDGIGGIWTALCLLGIPFVGYSCEVNVAAIQVVKARHPSVQHLGDVTALQLASIPEKVDLVVGGFPCQDLSSMGHRMGLHGQRSKLFFEMLRIINMLKPTWFLAENVASMAWQDRDEISKHLRTIPMEIDSQELTPSRRRRLYWSNIPYAKRIPRLRDHWSTSLQSVLKDGTALDSKIGCIMSTNTCRGGNAGLDLVMDNATCSLRYINVAEVEKAMGYPAGYTNIKFKTGEKNGFSSGDSQKEFEEIKPVTPRNGCNKTLRSGNKQLVGKPALQRDSLPLLNLKGHPVADGVNRNVRWNLLGNTFSVNVIAHLLSPLLERTGRAVLRPIVLPKSIREQDCSAMDPGEVWALYNDHERPNWYALIESRTGDRFSSCTQGRKKRPPVQIEVKFMEMVEAYSAQEADEWDTIRGTGLFRVRAVVDNQNSWVAFSHRMDNYLKVDDLYFIFPAKDEVWAVYDSVSNSRYLVYVVASRVDKNKAKLGQPGNECFYARCRILQRVDTELYRLLDKEIDFTDLSLFAFKAPYIFKNESTLLKIDLTTRQRAARSDYVKKQTRKRNRRGSDSELEEDEEEDEVILAEDIGFAEMMGVDGISRLSNSNDSHSTRQ